MLFTKKISTCGCMAIFYAWRGKGRRPAARRGRSPAPQCPADVSGCRRRPRGLSPLIQYHIVQPAAQSDAAAAVARIGALGTYLANLRDDPKRERYTELSRALEKIVADAPRTPAAQREKMFEPADRLFAEMNDDCVKSAKASQ